MHILLVCIAYQIKLHDAILLVMRCFQKLRGAKLLVIARLAGNGLVTVAACRTLAGPRS